MKSLLESTQAYTIVKTEAQKNSLSHAYLLLYDDARNLRFALKTFAKLFFYPAQERVSRLIDEESFADCLFFPAEGKKLTVEDAEKIREECALSPVEGKRKVFVLGDFSQANAQTQNKLLKSLEEPTEGVVFLLGATSAFSVLPTVLSRTKKLEIPPFDEDTLKNCLSRIYGGEYAVSAYELCAAASGGKLGAAQTMIEGGQYQVLMENAFSLALAPLHRLPALVKQIGESKQQMELLSALRLIFRDALVVKMQKGNGKNLLLKSESKRLQEVANAYSLTALLYAQEAISEAEKQVAFNAVFGQCIELCIAKIQRKNDR